MLLGGSKHCQEPSLKVLSSAYQKCHLLEVQSSEAALERSSQETHLYATTICFWKILAVEFFLLKIGSFHLRAASVVFVNFVYTFLKNPYL